MATTTVLISPELLVHLAEVDEDRRFLSDPKQLTKLARILLPILRNADIPELKATRFRLQATTNGAELSGPPWNKTSVPKLEIYLDLFDAALARRRTPSRKAIELTGRERKVLAFVDIWTGQTNIAIAEYTGMDQAAVSKVCRHLRELGLITNLGTKGARENLWVTTANGAAVNDEIKPFFMPPGSDRSLTPKQLARKLSGREIRFLSHLADLPSVTSLDFYYSTAGTESIARNLGLSPSLISKIASQLVSMGLLGRNRLVDEIWWELLPKGRKVIHLVATLPPPS